MASNSDSPCFLITDIFWQNSGTAIYVNFVLTTGITKLNFILDDKQLPHEFAYQQNVNAFVYNATVYSNRSLEPTGTGVNGTHNLTITSYSDMSFDFAKYTYVHCSVLVCLASNLLFSVHQMRLHLRT